MKSITWNSTEIKQGHWVNLDFSSDNILERPLDTFMKMLGVGISTFLYAKATSLRDSNYFCLSKEGFESERLTAIKPDTGKSLLTRVVMAPAFVLLTAVAAIELCIRGSLALIAIAALKIKPENETVKCISAIVLTGSGLVLASFVGSFKSLFLNCSDAPLADLPYREILPVLENCAKKLNISDFMDKGFV